MPRLPVVKPTTTLSNVMTTAARTEFPATARFSARIDSDEETAGLPDMQALSPLHAVCAKYRDGGGAVRRTTWIRSSLLSKSSSKLRHKLVSKRASKSRLLC